MDDLNPLEQMELDRFRHSSMNIISQSTGSILDDNAEHFNEIKTIINEYIDDLKEISRITISENDLESIMDKFNNQNLFESIKDIANFGSIDDFDYDLLQEYGFGVYEASNEQFVQIGKNIYAFRQQNPPDRIKAYLLNTIHDDLYDFKEITENMKDIEHYAELVEQHAQEIELNDPFSFMDLLLNSHDCFDCDNYDDCDLDIKD